MSNNIQDIFKMIDKVTDMKLTNTQWQNAWKNAGRRSRQEAILDYELVKEYIDKMRLV